ncbi:hypothetical protein LINPERHAP2_LOCUS13244 [Linum perenne]
MYTLFLGEHVSCFFYLYTHALYALMYIIFVHEHNTLLRSPMSGGRATMEGHLVIVDEEVNQRLARPVSNAEIKMIVFQFGLMKVSGHDDYPGCFFLSHWDLWKMIFVLRL